MSSSSTGPTADVSVRIAWADDAEAIAAVQVKAWRTRYVDLLPAEVLDALDPGAVAGGWRDALAGPRDARNRVLVALERNSVRGYAVTSPSDDPDSDPVADGEIPEVVVDPDHLGKGHGSRLVQACVDTLRADRFARAVTWINSTDDALRGFLVAAGWGPDGAHRELDLRGDGEVRVKQVRLHTDLAERG
jgi:GNAT superfamily N-acetyltransferase